MWQEGQTISEKNTPSTTTMESTTMSGISFGANITFDELAVIINQTRVQDRWFDPITESSLICAYVCVIAVGLTSNALVCFLVAKVKKLRTARNVFVINLAASDIVMCLFCMPLTLVKLLLKEWPLGETLCRVTPWLQAANVFASTITITTIALDRYHIILQANPPSTRKRLAQAIAIIGMIWIGAFLIGIPLAVYSRTIEQTYLVLVAFTMCVEQWPSPQGRFAYAAVVMILQFILPLSILAAVHWRISNFLKCRITRNATTLASVRSAIKETKRHQKNSSLLMAITIMYGLCWFPLTLLNFLADFNYTLFMYRDFLLAYAAAHLIAMTSAITNPILYGWYNTNFKRQFMKTICFWKGDERQVAPQEHDERSALFPFANRRPTNVMRP